MADGLVGSFGATDAQIVSLAKLVDMKRAANRKKDRDVLLELENALAEQRERTDEPD